jgi:hypothetical protein
MPSKSAKQARLMAAAAHDPDFAKRVGVPQSVAREFNRADRGSDILHRAMQHKGKKKLSALEQLMHGPRR